MTTINTLFSLTDEKRNAIADYSNLVDKTNSYESPTLASLFVESPSSANTRASLKQAESLDADSKNALSGVFYAWGGYDYPTIFDTAAENENTIDNVLCSVISDDDADPFKETQLAITGLLALTDKQQRDVLDVLDNWFPNTDFVAMVNTLRDTANALSEQAAA